MEKASGSDTAIHTEFVAKNDCLDAAVPPPPPPTLTMDGDKEEGEEEEVRRGGDRFDIGDSGD